MADDWKPGDLALCVRGGINSRAGRVYTVDDVIRPGEIRFAPDLQCTLLWNELCLVFAELPIIGRNACGASRFRKINPLSDEEREQFAADLNTREPTNA